LTTGVGGGRGQFAPSLIFGWLKTVGKFSFKNEKFVAEKPLFWEKFTVKIEVLRTRNFLSRKFAAVCRKTATFCPA